MGRTLLSIALFFIIVSGLAAFFYGGPADDTTPCREPLTYRFAAIDSRYNINEKQLANLMEKVEKLWATPLNRELIIYSSHGEIAIHLLYSKQQQKSGEERKLSNRIERKNQQLEVLKREYDNLSRLFKKHESEFKALLSSYNQQVAELNEDFAKWKAGGISAGEKMAIQKKKRKIDNLKYRAGQQSKEAKSLQKRLNQKAKWLQDLNSQTNELIKEYNQRFADSREFHQGQFIKNGDTKMIKILQFDNRNELKLVLAHEMGHALGLNHVENPESVMYYLMDEQNLIDLTLSKKDIKAIKNRCGT